MPGARWLGGAATANAQTNDAAQQGAAAAPSSTPAPASTAAPVGPAAPADDAAPTPSSESPAPSVPAGPDGTVAASDSAGVPTAESAQTAQWQTRDRDINEANTLTGGVGLLRTQHAESGAPGQLRVGFVAEWFTANFLCTPQYPCPNPTGGAALTSDTLDHVGGTLSLGMSFAKLGPGTLEGYASTTAYANNDAANRPSLLQVLGDTNLGAKYVASLGDIVRVGAFTELWLINGTGSVGLDGGGTSAKFGALGTADLRGLETPVPLRFSVDVVYSLDNTGAVLAATEAAQDMPVTRIERYGLGVNRVDHVDLFFGGEALLFDERVRPFLEAHVLVPSNRQHYQCDQTNPSGDDCLIYDHDVPSTLTIGGRFYPWKRGFSLLTALDIGLTGTKNFIEELQPVPPWTLFIGGGWAIDTWDRPPVVKTVEKIVERGRPLVHVVGFVHEKDKNDPVAAAIVSYRDRADLSPLATGPDGKFSDDVPPGTYTYDVRADGFKPATCEADASHASTASPAGPNSVPQVDIDCALEALPRTGTVLGVVRDADTGQALPNVQLVLTDPQHKELRLASDPGGGFRFEGVAPGTADLSVVADGYLALVAPTDVKPRQETTVDLMLRPKPKQPKVQITAKEITIKEQIQFALDSSVILPQSFGVLTEVADTLIRHAELTHVEVQGHTDSSGTAEHNQVLSDARAGAVRLWLVQHGVAADRLVARGYGQDNPLTSNATAADRARNRRVQFIILERQAGAGQGGAPAMPANGDKKAPAPGF
ncbi:MAG TPA: carboxypeptidase regulatory-like domain-containing protein [Polyangiaceae bacterium]|nr:carboxypeptidase regulatory-like domain-containing protein [Polyangiaceae bacterium]